MKKCEVLELGYASEVEYDLDIKVVVCDLKDCIYKKEGNYLKKI